MTGVLINKRFSALIIDVSLLGIIEVLITILLMIININEDFIYTYSLATSIIFSLFFCKDIINGQSIGKKILKLQVVSEKGEPVNLQNIIFRNLIAVLQPFDALYMINNNGKRLGDILCKTKVISITKEKIKYKFNFLDVIMCYIAVLFITFLLFYIILMISKYI